MMACKAKCTLRGALRSSVIWFNTALLAAIPLAQNAQDMLPSLREFLSPPFYRYAFIALAIVNILLRFKTKNSLAQKGATPLGTPTPAPGEPT